jgi:hypothetical protein
MSEPLSRRGFLRDSAAVAATAAMAMSFEEKALLAEAAGAPAPATQSSTPQSPAAPSAGGELPMGKIGKLTVSRLICGGNLISGFAHSRDLIYLSPLLTKYFTDEKICETLDLCESRGINTCILRVDAHTLRVMKKYRNEYGGKIQWIAQVKPTEEDPEGDINAAVEASAIGVYVHGGVGDDMVAKGKMDFFKKVVEIGRQRAAVVGLGAHDIATTKAYEAAGLECDFYMKTLNSKQYWSANAPTEMDNVWEKTPEETVAFMKGVAKPWIAFKVMGAGAIHPNEAFKYAFANGADFICAGMFDFQVVEDIMIAKNLLAGPLKRERAWIA